MKLLFVAVVLLASLCSRQLATAQELQLEIRETGYMTSEWDTWFVNYTLEPAQFDGYTFADGLERLNVDAWKSIHRAVLAGETSSVTQTFGPDALSFEMANPNPGNLTELMAGPGALLLPGAEWNLGPIMDLDMVDSELTFTYSSNGRILSGQLVRIVPGVPEPSAFILGSTGILALLVHARSLASRPKRL